MRRGFGFVVASSLIATVAFSAGADAQSRRSSKSVGMEASVVPTSGSQRRSKTKVRSYVARRGGYSYSPEDVINTYGDSRWIFGAANTYRDPMLNRQTIFGPFDQDFFFDSGIGPRGGNSPYQN